MRKCRYILFDTLRNHRYEFRNKKAQKERKREKIMNYKKCRTHLAAYNNKELLYFAPKVNTL